MSFYEICLIVGALSGVFLIISTASAALDSGSLRIVGVFIVLTAGAFYLARESNDGALDFDDIGPAVSKLVAKFAN